MAYRAPKELTELISSIGTSDGAAFVRAVKAAGIHVSEIPHALGVHEARRVIRAALAAHELADTRLGVLKQIFLGSVPGKLRAAEGEVMTIHRAARDKAGKVVLSDTGEPKLETTRMLKTDMILRDECKAMGISIEQGREWLAEGEDE